jgi:hypothetical protein
VNFVTSGADTSIVQQGTDYFVHLDATPGKRGNVAREQFESSDSPHKRKRRKKRSNSRSVLMLCLLLAVGGWVYWASQRPGGVSGTVNGWIEDVRGDIAKVSSDPDFGRAVDYYQAQFEATGRYPTLNENQLANAHIGVGIDVLWCAPNAVVIVGAAGGGSASRLLMDGKEVGSVTGRQPCPASLEDPKPW